MKRVIFGYLLLSGCAISQGTPTPSGPDTCLATPYQSLIGSDVTALERILIMREVRIIRPGTAVTMDNRETRINFDIGDDGRIRNIYCG